MPLSVNLRTDFGTYSNPFVGISLDYPTNLFVINPMTPTGAVRIQTSPLEINLGGALPEGPTSVSPSGFVIAISVGSVPQPFDIFQWIVNTYPHSEIDTISALVIGGSSAYVVIFKNQVGAGSPIAVVAHGSKVFRISYRSTFDLGSSENEQGLGIYYGVLRSVAFL
jgi:hypothetical protein